MSYLVSIVALKKRCVSPDNFFPVVGFTIDTPGDQVDFEDLSNYVGQPVLTSGEYGSFSRNKVCHADAAALHRLHNAFTADPSGSSNQEHIDVFPKSTTNQNAEGMSLKFILERFASGNYVPVGTSKMSRSDQWMTDDERMNVSVPRDSVERFQMAEASVAKGKAATEELKKLRETPTTEEQD